MSDAIEGLKQRFIGEAADGLARIDAWIAAIEGAGDIAHAGRIREEAHALKGGAAVLGLMDFRDRAAALEEYAAELSHAADWPPDATSRLVELTAAAREAVPAQSA